MNKRSQHYENSTLIPVTSDELFSYLDEHKNLSSHMSKSSWMMAGGSMSVKTDIGNGQKVGSHIRLNGKVFRVNLFLDEVVTKREPPYIKTWKTVGELSLIVIGHYQMGLEIEPENGNSRLKVYIDYELPNSFSTRWLGYLFGRIYAKWCVQQMIKGAREHFATKK